MKSYLKNIGVLDLDNKIHAVHFSKGLNVLTGKSSTGKSAMIEIFDYCLGNSNNTIPVGIITNSAKMYFIIISLNEKFLVIARDVSARTKGFIKELSICPDVNTLTIGFFEKDYFLPIKDFKETLGRYFGIDIEDTDTNLDDRKYRKNNAKSPRPSIRNMMSFLLQHQNLIANKHSIFYRFDESTKKEQTIDQFKIFAGFVTQEYFILKQELSDLEKELKILEKDKEIRGIQFNAKKEKLEDLLKEYLAITGENLIEDSASDILNNPRNTLDKLAETKIHANPDSNIFLEEINTYKKHYNQTLAEKRKLSLKLRDIQASINHAEAYEDDTRQINVVAQANLSVSECPFCLSKNENLIEEANTLEDAINWLNGELIKTPYLLDSFLSDKKEQEKLIEEKDTKLKKISSRIQEILKQVESLEKNKSIDEQALKVKLKIENFLEEKIEFNNLDFVEEIEQVSKKIKDKKKEIKNKFNVDKKIKEAEKYINDTMKELGEKFEFEASYKPINLNFSLSNFDLWHETSNQEKVYLRSMGSGANWLSSHLVLFTSLIKYFCHLGEKSLIPPILFLDQPSQVYFPITIDHTDKFDAKALKDQEGKLQRVDEDLSSVTNIYNQLIDFCEVTKKETGIEPQIIVIDHADHLQLANDKDFEKYVDGRRWRKRGFIN